MAIEGDPAIPRRRLRGKLREAREGSHLTREAAATELDWSLSKLVRIETGDQGISKTDLQALLQLYKVTNESTVEELTELARSGRGQPWWSSYREVVSRQYGQLLGYESSASYIHVMHPLLVPGLLHTDEYAFELRSAHKPEEQAKKLVDLLAQRQERLFDQPKPPEMAFIFGEEALNRWIGGPAVMRGQLRHLLKVAEGPSVSIQIVPCRAGAHPGLIGSFILLGLQDSGEDLLFLEGAGGDLVIRDDREIITPFTNSFEKVQSRALSANETRTLIEQKIDELSEEERKGSGKSTAGDRQSQGT